MLQKVTRENAARELIDAVSLPPVSLRLRNLAPDKPEIETLTDIIEAEPEFALRVIELVRLSATGMQSVSSVAEAIELVGADVVRSISLGLDAFEERPFLQTRKHRATRGQTLLSLEDVLAHSIGCGTIAARLSARAAITAGSHCFAAGFLHEIGRVILLRHWRKYLFEALAIARIKKIPVTEAEALVFGCNHMELGELWCRTVKLGPSLEAIIASHHPEHAAPIIAEERQRKIAALVQLADLICEAHDLTGGDNREASHGSLVSEFDLEAEEEDSLVADFEEDLQRAGPLFGIGFSRDSDLRARGHLRANVEQTASSGPVKGTMGKGRIIPFPGRTGTQSGRKTGSHDRKLTILIVEDHGSLCEMLSLYFMRHGYHVRTAMDGQSALEILSNEEIHLMLLDLMLPRLDGFAVLQHLREHREQKAPYVIVVSAGASAKDRSRVLELGADEYMPKPFHLIRLLERIHNVERYLLG